MGFWDFFKPRCRVLVERDGVRFEVEGDLEFVEHSLKVILKNHGRRALPRPERLPEDEDTQPNGRPGTSQQTQTVSGTHPWRRRRKLMRLHAMEGGISKVYPLDPMRMENSPLSKAVNFQRVRNVYVEGGLIAKRLKGDHKTVWHAIVPQQTESN